MVLEILHEANKAQAKNQIQAIMIKFNDYYGPCWPGADLFSLTPITKHEGRTMF